MSLTNRSRGLASYGILGFFFAIAASGQQLVTSLSSYNTDGQTVTIPIRVNCVAGSSAINALLVYLKTDPAAAAALTTIHINPITREVQLFDGENWTMWPPPVLVPGSANVTWGAAGKIEITGYTFVDPAATGNEFRLDLTLKRYTPYTGLLHVTLGAIANIAGTTVFSQPWWVVSAGTWNYAPSVPPTWTVTPASFSIPAGPYAARASVTGVPASVPVVTAGASWLQVVGSPALSGFDFRAEPNTSGVSRSAAFSVTANAATPRIVSISQAAAISQQPTTSLASYVADGQTINIPIRVASANGASAISNLLIFLKTDPAGDALSYIAIDLVARNLQLFYGPNWTMWPLPAFTPGSASVSWGALGKIEIIGYNFRDPATTGNELQIDLTLKRYAPQVGRFHFTLAAFDPVAGSSQFSVPWMGVSAGIWDYTPAATGDFTFSAPTSITAAYNQAATFTGTLTPVGGAPGNIALNANLSGVIFNPASPLNLPDLSPRNFTINLPARTDSYTLSLSAQAGAASPKSRSVTVTVSPPSILLTTGSFPPVYAGDMASVPLQIATPTFSGTVDLFCTSTSGLSCPLQQSVQVVAGSSVALSLSIQTSPTTPSGAVLNISAIPRGISLPAGTSTNVSVSILPGFNLQVLPAVSALQGNPSVGTVSNAISVRIVPSGGFSGTINFSCPVPANVSCSGSAVVTGSRAVDASVNLIVTQLSGSSATYTLTVRGTAGFTRDTSTSLTAYLTTPATITDPLPGFGVDPATGLPRRGKIARQGNSPIDALTKFSWTAGLNATGYRLQIDTSAGSGLSTGDVFDESTNNRFSPLIPVRPPGANTQYSIGTSWRVTLTTYNGSTVIGTDTKVYDLVEPIAPPTGFSPAAGTTLTTNQIFTWFTPVGGGTAPSQYRLLVGRLGPGSSDVFTSAPVTANTAIANSLTVSGLPVGYPLFVTLESNFPSLGGWQLAQHYLYSGATSSGSGGTSISPGTISVSGPALISSLNPGGSVSVGVTVTSTDGYVGPLRASCAAPAGLKCFPATSSLTSDQSSVNVPIVVQADPNALASPLKTVTVSLSRPDNGQTYTAAASVTVGALPSINRRTATSITPLDVYTDNIPVTDTFYPVTIEGLFPAPISYCYTYYGGLAYADVDVRVTESTEDSVKLTFKAGPNAFTGPRVILCYPAGVNPSFTSLIVDRLYVYDATPVITNIYDSSRRPFTIDESAGAVPIKVEGSGFGIVPFPNLRIDPPIDYRYVTWGPNLLNITLNAPKPGRYSVSVTSTGNNLFGSGFLGPDPARSNSISNPVTLNVLPRSNVNAPVLTGISEDRAYRGRSGRITLTGTNLASVNSVLVSNLSGIVLSIDERGGNSLEVIYEIPSNATAGDRSISVSNGFQTSNGLTWRIGDGSPVIEQVSPSDWFKGETTSVVISGSGFGVNPLLDAGPGITFSNVIANDEFEISAQVTVAPDASPDERTLTLTSQGALGNGFQGVAGAASSALANARLVLLLPRVELTVVEKGRSSRLASPGSVVFISGYRPEMPQITARLLNADPSLQVAWSLEIQEEYCTRSAGCNVTLKSCFPSSAARSCPAAPVTVASTEPWVVDWGAAPNLRGGSATISWVYAGITNKFNFRVGGADPSTEDLKRALGYSGPGLNYTPYWFSWGLMWSESSAHQFCPYTRENCRKSDPLWGTPSGYGLMQIDRESGQTTTPDERWDWVENVRSGMDVIAQKLVSENAEMRNRNVVLNRWNVNPLHRDAQVGLPSPTVAFFVDKVGNRTNYPECTFLSGTGPIWWANTGSSQGSPPTEFRPWVDSNAIMAYLGGPRLLRISGDGVTQFPQWYLTPTFAHLGNPEFSKVGAACAAVRDGRK